MKHMSNWTPANAWQFTKRDLTQAILNLHGYLNYKAPELEKTSKRGQPVCYEMRFDVPTIQKTFWHTDKLPTFIGELQIGLSCVLYYSKELNRIWLKAGLYLTQDEHRKSLAQPVLHGEWDGNKWDFSWMMW